MRDAVSKWVILDDTLISVTGPGTPPDDLFQIFLADLRKDAVKSYLGATLGKTDSTSVQRKQLSEIMKSRGIRTATVTDNALIRGAATALSWMGVKIKAFPWSETKAALAYLGVEGSQAKLALDMLGQLRAEVEATFVEEPDA